MSVESHRIRKNQERLNAGYTSQCETGAPPEIFLMQIYNAMPS